MSATVEPGAEHHHPLHVVGGRRARTATLYLLVVTMLWGGSFLWMQLGTGSLAEVLGGDSHLASGALFLLVRYVLSALVMALVFPGMLRKVDREAWRAGFWVSIPFTLGMVLQIFGLTFPDLPPSQSAFITSLYVVVIPVLTGLWTRAWPTRGVLAGIPLATFGAAFIAGPPSTGLSVGAWATLASAFVFSFQILALDRVNRRVDPIALTFAQVVLTSPWLLVTLLVTAGPRALAPATLAAAFARPPFVWSLAACIVLATVIALAMMNRWQKELSPSRAAIVYTAEPVFAAVISIAVGHESVTAWLLVGSVSILLANLSAAFIGQTEPT